MCIEEKRFIVTIPELHRECFLVPHMVKMTILYCPTTTLSRFTRTMLGKCQCCCLIAIRVKDKVLVAVFFLPLLSLSNVAEIGSLTQAG